MSFELQIGPPMFPNYVRKIFDNGWEMQWVPRAATREDFKERVFRKHTSGNNANFHSIFGGDNHIFFDLRTDNRWILFYEASPEGIQQLKWKVDPRILQFLLRAPRDERVRSGLVNKARKTTDPKGTYDVSEAVCKYVGGSYKELKYGLPIGPDVFGQWGHKVKGYYGSTAGHGSREVTREATSPLPSSECIVKMSKSPGYNNWEFRVPKHLKHLLVSYWE